MMTASLRLLGTSEVRDMFVINVMIVTSSSTHNLISSAEMGSRQQDLLLDRYISMRTLSSPAGRTNDNLETVKIFSSSKTEFTPSVLNNCNVSTLLQTNPCFLKVDIR